MEFHVINLVYFIIIIPIVVLVSLLLLKLREKKKIIVILILSILLFIVRFTLIFFQNTIGVMPYLVEDVIFYGIIMIFGVFTSLIYTFRIEKASFKEIGGDVKNAKRSILYGLLGFIPLVCILPLFVFLANIQLSWNITFGKIFVGFSFTILAAVYEEIFFRGIIQNHFSEITDDNQIKTIIFTAIIFTVTHFFYLPFIGFGIYYIFVFIMALVLSVLRIKSDLLACAITHGGIVFIPIIFV